MGSLRFTQSIAALSLYVGAALLTAVPAHAQDEQQAPAHIAFVDGAASLDRDGQTEPVTGGVPFVPGDRLRTDRGRVEILFPDGSALDVDQFTSLDLLSPTLLRVTSGRVRLAVAGSSDPSAAVRYQIDTPVASALTDGPGEYRVALLTGPTGMETELAVLRGFAALSTERGSMNVRAGERTLARDQESPLYPQVFNSARFDAFDRWAEARRIDRARTTASTQYLPSDLQMYGSTFDRHGAWQYEPSYGQVWYPSVAFDWRPYYNGYWSSIRPYGWTWIGLDAWSWPTHHYGRWGHARNRWFWIPERRWSSAWVSWGAAPGYVSWCPLGFDNRPVFGLNVVGSAWTGWVVIPRTHFGGYRVSQWAVAPHRLRRNTPFATLASSPVPPPRRYAVPRSTVAAGDRTGSFAVPRRAPANSQPAIAGGPQPRRGDLDRRAAAASQSQTPGNGARQAVRDPDAAAVTRQPYAGMTPLPIERSARTAIRRQPSADNRIATPGAAATSSMGQSNPTPGRPEGSAVYRQALPRAPGLPQSRPLPQSAPASQRSRQATPRWSLPGGGLQSPPPARDSGPGTGIPPARAPRVPPQRGEGYSRPTAPYAAPPEAARPTPSRSPGMSMRQSGPPPEAARPAPSRSPGMAVPRSARPTAAPNAPAASPPPAPRSHDGGGGGGARQRRPS